MSEASAMSATSLPGTQSYSDDEDDEDDEVLRSIGGSPQATHNANTS